MQALSRKQRPDQTAAVVERLREKHKQEIEKLFDDRCKQLAAKKNASSKRRAEEELAKETEKRSVFTSSACGATNYAEWDSSPSPPQA